MDANLSAVPSRRQALFGATLTFGAVWAGLSLPGAAAAQGVPAWAPKALAATQARTLEAVCEVIFPATDTPGAREAGVAGFIDQTIAAWSAPRDASAMRVGLDRMEAESVAAHGQGFAALTTAQQTALLTRYDAEARAAGPAASHFFRLIRDLATVGYFTSEPGATRAVRYDPVPGDYRGCVPLSHIGRAWAT